MAAVSRPGSWWGALSVVLVATGASLLISGALLVHHVTLEERFVGNFSHDLASPPAYLRSSIALLAAVGVLVAAAWRPDRWAPWLTRLGAPAARVYLPLTLAFLALPLGILSVGFYERTLGFTEAAVATSRVLALTFGLGLPTFLIALRTRILRDISHAALPLSGLLLLAGGAVAVQDSLTERPANHVDSRRDYLASFGPARTLLEPIGDEGAAGSEPLSSADPVLEPSMVDTMVERHVRGAGERPVERRAQAATFTSRSLDISLADVPMTLYLTCVDSSPSDGCRSVLAHVSSPRWGSETASFKLDPRSPTELRLADDGERLLFSNRGDLHSLDPASGFLDVVDLDSLAIRLRQRQPLPWRLAPLGALAVVLLLCARRGAVSEWHEALRDGVPVRVRDGWVRGPDGFEASTELRDGPALLVEEVRHASGYREASILPAGVLVPGRQQTLVDRALLNVRLIDATALLVTALSVAPVLAVGLAQLVLSR